MFLTPEHFDYLLLPNMLKCVKTCDIILKICPVVKQGVLFFKWSLAPWYSPSEHHSNSTIGTLQAVLIDYWKRNKTAIEHAHSR